MEGTLTEFAGYPFGPDLPVTYLEAKRVQRLAMDELRKTKSLEKRIHANLSGPGRSSITGSKAAAVWDYIPLHVASDGEAFTKSPHLTHGINDKGVQAMVTFPNSLSTDLRRTIGYRK